MKILVGLRPVIDFRANFFKDLTVRNYSTELHLVCCPWQIIVSSFMENTRKYQHLRNNGSKLTLKVNMSNPLKAWLQAPTRPWENLRVLAYYITNCFVQTERAICRQNLANHEAIISHVIQFSVSKSVVSSSNSLRGFRGLANRKRELEIQPIPTIHSVRLAYYITNCFVQTERAICRQNLANHEAIISHVIQFSVSKSVVSSSNSLRGFRGLANRKRELEIQPIPTIHSVRLGSNIVRHTFPEIVSLTRLMKEQVITVSLYRLVVSNPSPAMPFCFAKRHHPGREKIAAKIARRDPLNRLSHFPGSRSA
eukprot:sb/3467102/